jgi:hypothetical protein
MTARTSYGINNSDEHNGNGNGTFTWDEWSASSVPRHFAHFRVSRPVVLARETIELRSSRVATSLLAEEPIDTDNS